MPLQKKINRIIKYAESFGTKKYKYNSLNKWIENCTLLKNSCINKHLYEYANELLLLESVLIIHKKYLNYYKLIIKDKQEEAWNLIIDVEEIIDKIRPYLYNKFPKYKLDVIEDKNKKIQTLYPYTHFLSTGYSFKNYKCSICGEKITINHNCSHKKGHIYNGKWCYWVIENIVKFDHVAIVENPKDKHCILTKIDGERYDFSVVNELVKNIKRPYLNWNIRWTKIRHPHKFYKDTAETDKCPCGSGLLYRDCCLNECGVLRPHVDFDLGQGFSDNPNIIKYHYPPKKKRDNKEPLKASGILLKYN